MNNVVELTAKLSASIEKENIALMEIQRLSELNSSMFKEIDHLQALLDQRLHEHDAAIDKETKRSFKSGHSTAIKEMKDLWSSKEYAAELMYGKNII